MPPKAAPWSRESSVPEPQQIFYGAIGLIVLLGFAVGRTRGVYLAGPALVLRQFTVNPAQPDSLVALVGRPEGVVGWFLSALGIDTTTSLLITHEYVYITSSSLSGQFRE